MDWQINQFVWNSGKQIMFMKTTGHIRPLLYFTHIFKVILLVVISNIEGKPKEGITCFYGPGRTMLCPAHLWGPHTYQQLWCLSKKFLPFGSTKNKIILWEMLHLNISLFFFCSWYFFIRRITCILKIHLKFRMYLNSSSI